MPTQPNAAVPNKVVPKVNRRAKRGAAGPALVVDSNSLCVLVDEIGRLEACVAANTIQMAPTMEALKAKREKLLAQYAALPEGVIATVEGERFVVKIGMKAEEQSVIAGGLKRVFEFVGADKFI